MKNKTTIQITKEFKTILKSKKIIPEEPYEKMMMRTFKENDDLKKKIKDMVKLK